MVDFPQMRGYGQPSGNPAEGLDLPQAPAQPRMQPVAEVRIAITALHQAMVKEPDPEDKAVISTCLSNLMKLQAKNAKQSGSTQQR